MKVFKSPLPFVLKCALAKFWLNPVRQQKSRGFGSHELREIQKIVGDNRQQFQEKWDEYFGA